MPKAVRRGIISQKPHAWDGWIIAILAVAAAVRFWHIGELTEFLGDQGRTMMILSEWVRTGVAPLAGPTTLTGQHLGPMFYYLILPGYPGGPLGVAMWSALIGVA